jgi:hypothetical protein
MPKHVGMGEWAKPAEVAVRQAGMGLFIAWRVRIAHAGEVVMVDAAKLLLFAGEALALLGLLYLCHRIIRMAKRRSDPVNRLLVDGKPSVPSVGGRTENDKKPSE